MTMTALNGPARARWFDPATGNYLSIAEGIANDGSSTFTTPGARGDGTDDWLLVLDTVGISPCGSITPDGSYTPPRVASSGVRCEITAGKIGEPGVIATLPVERGGDRRSAESAIRRIDRR